MATILNDENRSQYNPTNERLIKQYLEHIQNTVGADAKTLNTLHKSIRCFEVLTDFAPLNTFNADMAKQFRTKVHELELSASYLLRISRDVQNFLHWLSHEPKGRKVKYNDADYLNLTTNETNRARASGYKPHHEYNILLQIVRNMPSETILDQRNRALVALIILSSPRISELTHLRIDSLKQERASGAYFLDINPRYIKGVKFNKPRQPTLLNIPDLRGFVLDWIEYLKINEGFKPEDPMFPMIQSTFAQNMQSCRTVQKKPISVNTTNRIFKEACLAAGYESYGVHSVRRTRVRFMEQQTADDRMVATQQDLGHNSLGTTRCNYGSLPPPQQHKIMHSINVEKGE